MAVTVTLATNRLQINDGTLRESVTYINIQDLFPITRPSKVNANPGTVLSTQWVVGINLVDKRRLEIELGDVTGRPTWTNDAAGYAIAEAAIYAAFPVGGGGGGGTVTSVDGSGGTTGMTLTGGPIVASGTLTLGGTLDLDNGGTGATTALDARVNLEAAKNHGVYGAGLVVNGYDLVQRNGFLYWSVSAQFTTTNWVADQANFVEIGMDSSTVAVSRVTKAITQVGHGFAVGDVLYCNGGPYDLADKTNAGASNVMGIVFIVTDADNFTLMTHGYMEGLAGLNVGNQYFLDTAGAMTDVDAGSGEYSVPLLMADTATTGHFNIQRGYLVP